MSQASSSQGTAVRAARVEKAAAIAVWAVGERRPLSEREWRLTAAVLAQVPGVVEHVRHRGCLPASLPGGMRAITLRGIVVERGIDLDLSYTEREVLAALDADGEIPVERAVLLDGRAL